MQGQKGKCKDEKENARTTQKAIPWIAASKSSDQKHDYVGGKGGPIILKMWLRNIWMVPYGKKLWWKNIGSQNNLDLDRSTAGALTVTVKQNITYGKE